MKRPRRSAAAHSASHFVWLAATLLSACAQSPRQSDEALPAIRSRDVAPSPVLATNLSTSTNSVVSGYGVRGTGLFTRRAAYSGRAAATDTGAGYTLNFVNADVGDVAKTVLGDILHLNYVIDATVQGSITLRTSRPLARAEVLPALEESFRLSNLGLIDSGGTFRVVPLADAAKNGNAHYTLATATRTPGYGIDVIPLKYIGAADMLHLLGPLAGSEGEIKTDESRNLLIVSGTSQERAAIAYSVALFDVDFMAGMSFALIPLHEATASTVVSEITNIMTTKGGPLDGIVRFVAIDRLHSILVVSPQPRYLNEARAWIARLDQAETGDEKRVFVYEVQNGRAQDLAGVLNTLLGSGGDKSTDKTAAATTEAPAGITGGLGDASAKNSGSAEAPLATGSPLSGSLPGAAPQAGDSSESGPHITADPINNAILFYGTAAEYRSIEASLAQLDVPPMQVMLEAVIAEVTLTDKLNFGVQYSFQDSHNQLVNTAGGAAIVPSLPGLAYTFASGNIKVILDALSGITKVKVISAPKLLVLNNQPAQLDVGDDVPITTETAQSTLTSGAPVVSSVQYRETGVILRVTPRVNHSGQVQMDVSQEVSGVVPTTSSTLNSPTFDERKISSTVSVEDGETVALGGLISDSRSTGTSGIPYLQNIPYLGALFSQKNNETDRTELLVLITPHVVQSVERLRAVTAELRLHMGEVETLLTH